MDLGYAGKISANHEYDKDKSDREIISNSGRIGAGVGALTGAGVGAGLTPPFVKSTKGRLIFAGAGGALGALGGRNSARVNTKARLNKKRELDEGYKD